MCVNEDKILRMKDLIKALTEADIAYYRDDDPVMSDREYDQLTDELLKLEAETGLVISGSPTQKVSGEVLEELTSVRHTKPMLSAKKTKSIEEMVRFAGGRSVLVSWKLDGLTIVLRYENGELKQSIHPRPGRYRWRGCDPYGPYLPERPSHHTHSGLY